MKMFEFPKNFTAWVLAKKARCPGCGGKVQWWGVQKSITEKKIRRFGVCTRCHDDILDGDFGPYRHHIRYTTIATPSKK